MRGPARFWSGAYEKGDRVVTTCGTRRGVIVEVDVDTNWDDVVIDRLTVEWTGGEREVVDAEDLDPDTTP